jgi:hypothetical protein
MAETGDRVDLFPVLVLDRDAEFTAATALPVQVARRGAPC